MRIGKNYKIESDGRNVTVMQSHVSKKTGKETWTAIAYNPTVASALKYLVDHEIKGTGLIDFKTVVARQEDLYQLIAGLEKGK